MCQKVMNLLSKIFALKKRIIVIQKDPKLKCKEYGVLQ